MKNLNILLAWSQSKNPSYSELEEATGHRQILLQELQAKQQRILRWRQLVVRSGTAGEVAGPDGGPESDWEP